METYDDRGIQGTNIFIITIQVDNQTSSTCFFILHGLTYCSYTFLKLSVLNHHAM